jgi:hypothetical protein
MKKKIVLSWDDSTGMVYDAKEMYVGTNLTLTPFEQPAAGVAIDDLVKLRDAGFTTEEIIELKRKELL